MKLSPYSKALLAAYRDLKRAGKSLDEIKEQSQNQTIQEQNQLNILENMRESNG